MNHLARFREELSVRIAIAIFLPGVLGIASLVLLSEVFDVATLFAAICSLLIFSGVGLICYNFVLRGLFDPVEKIWQAVWHVSPSQQNVAAPVVDSLKTGRELVASLVREIYDLASHGTKVQAATGGQQQSNNSTLLNELPLPVIILDKNKTIQSYNYSFAQYIGLEDDKIRARSVYDVLRMSFVSEDTFDKWLEEASTTRATDNRMWEHVRIDLDDNKGNKQFDLAASYSKDNSEGREVMMILFDHTATYKTQDEATSYVALAVHELRTPLTVMRGYIEVFEDELGSSLTPELREFMRKMAAAAQSLTAFVSNILNVARVDENQLVLKLDEADWSKVLPEIVKDLELRAGVRGKVIELNIAPDLPTVAIDKISMYEVVSNLIDNAIKYSGTSPKIIVSAQIAKDGTIETVVQDFGVGMPESVIKQLFTRYYRSHRSKNAVSGSGLGLYLVKAIVTAHGGQVWVQSKEGEGSRFAFTLQDYKNASGSQQNPDGIERQANGWIKNHSLYRS